MTRWSDHSAFSPHFFSLRTRQRGDRTRQGSRLPAGCHDRQTDDDPAPQQRTGS